jgi:hypothetical protein
MLYEYFNNINMVSTSPGTGHGGCKYMLRPKVIFIVLNPVGVFYKL